MKRPTFLTEHRSSRYFTLYYTLRESLTGGGGVHGVRDLALIDHYFDALERAFCFLMERPLSFETLNKKVPVYVFEIRAQFPDDGSPHTFQDQDGNPYIALPSRTDAPTRDEEYRHAIASACHEAFHAVVWHLYSRRKLENRAWIWFDEGCAVWAETQVRPDILDYLRFGMNWCDRPELPIDDIRNTYESVFFVWYLANRAGSQIVGEIWRSGEPTPWKAIQELQSEPVDLLLQDYFRDAFFLAETSSRCHSPQLLERYCGRAVRKVLNFTGSSTTTASLTGRLERQSCHYYKVISSVAPKLRVKQAAPQFHADIVAATKDGRVARDPEYADHWVIIACNSSLTSCQSGVIYELEVAL